MKVSITNPAGLRCHLNSARFPSVKLSGSLTQEIAVADQDHLNWLVAGLRVVNPSAIVAVVTGEPATSEVAESMTEEATEPDSAVLDDAGASATTTRKRSKSNNTQE